MKKLLSFLMSISLTLGMTTSALAAPVAGGPLGVESGSAVFTAAQTGMSITPDAQTGAASVTLALNPAAFRRNPDGTFASSGSNLGLLTVAALNDSDVVVVLTVTDNNNAGAAVAGAALADKAGGGVQLVLPLPNGQINVSTPFSYNVQLRDKINNNTAAAVVSGNVLPTNPNDANGYTASSFSYTGGAQTLQPGDSFIVPLSSQVFTTVGGGTKALDAAAISTLGMGAALTGAGSGNFDVSLNSTNVRITAKNNPSPGSYSNLKLSLTSGIFGAGPEQSLAVTVQIPVTNYTFSGVNDGGGLGGISHTNLAKEDSFTVTLTKENLLWSTGNQGVYDFSGFNSSLVQVITPSGGQFSVTNVQTHSNNGGITVSLKANAAYSGQIHVALKSGSDVSAGLACQITVTDTSGPQEIQKTQSGSAPTSSFSGATILKDNTFTITFPANNFAYSQGNATYMSQNVKNWVQTQNAGSFEVVSADVAANGSVVVTMKAKTAGSFTNLTVYLNGGAGGADTQKFVKSGTITIGIVAFAIETITTTQAGTAPTASGSIVRTGDTLTLSFPMDNFVWTTGGGPDYDATSFTNFHLTWVKVTSGGSDVSGDFLIANATTDTTGGEVKITLTALKANTYANLAVYLDSGVSTGSYSNPSLTVAAQAISSTQSGGTAPAASPGGNVSLQTGDTLTYTFPADNFVWNGNPVAGVDRSGASFNNTSHIRLSGAIVGVDFSVAYVSVDPTGGTVTAQLTALKSGTYNNLRMYLQSGAATTMSAAQNVTVTAIASGKIDGIMGGSELGGQNSGVTLNGRSISYSDLSSLDLSAGDEIRFELIAGFFTWSGNTPYPLSPVTTSQLSSGKITVRSSNRKGSKWLDEIKFEQINGKAWVLVKIADPFVSTREEDIEYTIYLSVNGKRDTDSQVTLAGTLYNNEILVSSGDEYVDLSDGSIVKADSYVRNIEVYLGNGVSIWTNMFNDRKYYGVATIEIDKEDEDILSKYSTIDYVVHLNTVNLNSTSNKVSFDMDGSNYYVYNADGKYLGRSNEKLAYSSKYYFSTRRITMSGTAVEEIDDPSSSSTGSGSGGSSTSGAGTGTGTTTGSGGTSGSNTANGHYNPPVGAASGMPAAFVASLLLLAAGVVVLRKK